MAEPVDYTDPYGIQDTLRRRRTKPTDNPFEDTGAPTTTDTGIPQAQSNPYQPVVDAYQTYLGRTPSKSEVASQTGNSTWLGTDPRLFQSVQNIRYSPEALAYASGKPWNAPGGYAKENTPTPNDAVPAYAATAMPGWDQTKWADPAHTTPKYTVGRILSQYDASPNALQQALPAIQAALPGTTLVGIDSLNIPGVGIVDVGGNFSGQGAQNWWWGPDSEAGMGGATAGMAGAGTGGVAGVGGGTGLNASSAYGGGGGFGDAIKSKILALMGQSPTNVMTNPAYTGAIDAYRTEQQRAMERERNAIAERMAAEGTANTGGMSNRLLAAEQQAGENTASFAGQLAVRELEMQRDEIMQALQLGAGLLTDEQRLALTEKLGMIDASLREMSINNQNNQFNQNLGWDMAQFQWLQNLFPFLTGS